MTEQGPQIPDRFPELKLSFLIQQARDPEEVKRLITEVRMVSGVSEAIKQTICDSALAKLADMGQVNEALTEMLAQGNLADRFVIPLFRHLATASDTVYLQVAATYAHLNLEQKLLILRGAVHTPSPERIAVLDAHVEDLARGLCSDFFDEEETDLLAIPDDKTPLYSIQLKLKAQVGGLLTKSQFGGARTLFGLPN